MQNDIREKAEELLQVISDMARKFEKDNNCKLIVMPTLEDAKRFYIAGVVAKRQEPIEETV